MEPSHLLRVQVTLAGHVAPCNSHAIEITSSIRVLVSCSIPATLASKASKQHHQVQERLQQLQAQIQTFRARFVRARPQLHGINSYCLLLDAVDKLCEHSWNRVLSELEREAPYSAPLHCTQLIESCIQVLSLAEQMADNDMNGDFVDGATASKLIQQVSILACQL